jgi:hypothetical protein
MNTTRTLTNGVLIVLATLSFPALCVGEEMPPATIGKVSAVAESSTKKVVTDKAAIDALANSLLTTSSRSCHHQLQKTTSNMAVGFWKRHTDGSRTD